MLRAIFCFLMMMNFANAKPQVTLAKPGDAPPPVLDANSEISIIQYIKSADVFEFQINDEKGVGPNFATTDALKKAIGRSETKDEFIREMLRDTSIAYVTKKPLTVIWDSDVEARKKKSPPAKNKSK